MLVVPGVGAAGPAMERLRATGLAGAVRAAADRGAHVLGICLGLQLLFDRSEEGDTECLGLLPGAVRRIDWAQHRPAHGLERRRPRRSRRARRHAARRLLLRTRLRRRAGRRRRRDRDDRARRHAVPVRRRSADAWRRCSSTRSGAAPPAARCSPRSFGGAAMLRRRIIPCLDVRRGRLVKGVRFRDLRDCGDPVDAAARYAEAGADEIVWLNISAGEEAWAELLHAVERAARRVDVPLCVGGGVDGFERAHDLLLAGADKVSVNTAAARPARARVGARRGPRLPVRRGGGRRRPRERQLGGVCLGRPPRHRPRRDRVVARGGRARRGRAARHEHRRRRRPRGIRPRA